MINKEKFYFLSLHLLIFDIEKVLWYNKAVKN